MKNGIYYSIIVDSIIVVKKYDNDWYKVEFKNNFFNMLRQESIDYIKDNLVYLDIMKEEIENEQN